MALRRLGHTPGSKSEKEWHNSLAQAFSNVAGQVCRVCGLGGVGHGPESIWLGHDPHTFVGIAATAESPAQADKLTLLAYQKRRETGTHSICGHNYAGKQCQNGDCPHVAGHCGNCD